MIISIYYIDMIVLLELENIPDWSLSWSLCAQFSIQQPSSYNLRRNDNGRLLEGQSVKTKKTLGDRAFQVAAPFLWNKLPRSAREATNLESFKTLIKTFLFKESFQLS